MSAGREAFSFDHGGSLALEEMADPDQSTSLDENDTDAPVDGRVARRERNIEAVIDCVLEMFGEESMFPTIEQAATRSGLSLRSVYRYFADPSELLEAVIKRSREKGEKVSQLHTIGEGPFAERLDAFVDMRLRLHESVGPVYRATVANAAQHSRVRSELTRNRNDLRRQFEIHFADELRARKPAEREAALSAGDLLCQLDSIDYLRRHRQFSRAEAAETLSISLRSLLDPG